MNTRAIIVLHALLLVLFCMGGKTQSNRIPMVLFFQGESGTAKLDFCSIVNCGTGDRQDTWLWSEKYICVTGTDPEYGNYAVLRYDHTNCGDWGLVGWNTSPKCWGYTPIEATSRISNGENLLKRMTILKGTPPSNCKINECNPLFLSIKNPTRQDSGIYILGAWITGEDPLGRFRIVVRERSQSPVAPVAPTSLPIIGIKYLANLKYEDKLALETGFSDLNVWIEWIRYTVLSQKRSDCIACAAARPHLGTVPFPLDEITDPEGFKCILKMYSETIPSNNTSPCKTLALIYPTVHKGDHMGLGVTPYPGNYTCFNRNGTGKTLGVFPPGYCSHIIQLNETSNDFDAYPDSWFINQNYQHADIWWLCGDLKLRPRMQMEWTGQCTLIKVLMPFVLFSPPEWDQISQQHTNIRSRLRRSLSTSFDSHVYIDAIGVPRGVPDEFKARNQIAAGFESLIPMISINKNVDWINYLYYNQQRFVNYTRDAIKGIAEQLSSSSVMTLQNRLALDMILAENVCKMIGSSCCTYIPNNTAPDGSITKALKGLTALSNELAENSGINNPFTSWLEQWFGSWSNVFINLLITVVIVFIALALIGCCIIPCFKKIVLKIFNTSMPSNTMYMHCDPVKDKDYYEQLFEERNSILKQSKPC